MRGIQLRMEYLMHLNIICVYATAFFLLFPSILSFYLSLLSELLNPYVAFSFCSSVFRGKEIVTESEVKRVRERGCHTHKTSRLSHIICLVLQRIIDRNDLVHRQNKL